ncbi:hypothetical protein MMC30_009203, partial [Trapelia coarctata]|nr:hypothetical protein [Trapelia coarctata]
LPLQRQLQLPQLRHRERQDQEIGNNILYPVHEQDGMDVDTGGRDCGVPLRLDGDTIAEHGEPAGEVGADDKEGDDLAGDDEALAGEMRW